MEELALFKRQFILTVYENFDLPWRSERILNYNLFYHPELEFEHVSEKDIDLYLLGFIFDYENPEFSNKQILDSLSRTNSFDNFIEHLSKYSGHYVVILRLNMKLILINDACAQQEIYYDISYSSFGSQPKLVSKVIPLVPHSSVEAAEFYSSPTFFLKEKMFIGDTTHAENIKHLRPNHFIDIGLKSIIRFFPKDHIKPITIDEAATKACEMLKGYIKAASLRNKLYMGVTAGYDTRVLFLASLDVDCKYYVTKLSYMNDVHYDIVIPQKLTKIFNKEFRVILESPIDNYANLAQKMSIDFPREIFKPDEEYKDHILINGNLSEIARNFYSDFHNVLPGELAILYGYAGCKFVCKEFEKWLINSSELFSENGYNLLDMFYWEEKMGNWAAKAKTEMSALGTTIYSPFSSHRLLTTLLSTPRKQRDAHFNILYNSIIKILSPDSSKIPVNPSQKKKIILLLKTLKIFNIIQLIRLKFALLRTLGTEACLSG